MDWDKTLEQLNHRVTVPIAVERWGGAPDSLRYVRTGVNAVFRFQRNNTGCYLRIAHDGLIDSRKVTSALRFLSHLWREGAAVCEPIASVNGQLMESISIDGETESLPSDGNWMATVTREVAGTPLGWDLTELAAFEAWGRCLGSLHDASRSYISHPEDAFGTSGIHAHRENWKRTRQRINDFDHLALQEYAALDAWYESLPIADDHPEFGLLHGDTNAHNVIWDGRSVTAIDFDEPGWGWFVEDVARSFVTYWWKDQRHLFRDSFLRGYRSVREFSEFWEKCIPFMMRRWSLGYYLEWNPYPSPEAIAEADREDTLRPGDFAWLVRKRFVNSLQWD